MIKCIVTGGQTGVDRSALDVAIELKIPYKGWCPQGRLDEQGIIPEKYSYLKEISGNFKNEKENYDARTKLNIRDSDGTVILVPNLPLSSEIKDGTLLTIQEVRKQKKPFLILDLSTNKDTNREIFLSWLIKHNISELNIAGPRESSSPKIYDYSKEFLKDILESYINTYIRRPKL